VTISPFEGLSIRGNMGTSLACRVSRAVRVLKPRKRPNIGAFLPVQPYEEILIVATHKGKGTISALFSFAGVFGGVNIDNGGGHNETSKKCA